jgi:hypothetical protein
MSVSKSQCSVTNFEMESIGEANQSLAFICRVVFMSRLNWLGSVRTHTVRA